MNEVLYVRLVDGHGSVLLFRDESNRYIKVKGRELGYVHGHFCVPNGPNRVNLVGTGFGAVKSRADADRLASALREEFQRHHRIEVEQRLHPDASDIVWHYNEAV